MTYLATAEPPATMRERDLEQAGFVMNLSRVWAHHPSLHKGLFDLLGEAVRAASLTYRQRAILVVACASTLGDPYCALAWGKRLAGVAGAEVAAAVLRGDDGSLDDTERALARWARVMTRDPNATRPDDLRPLYDAGYDDAQIFAITTFVALRAAFATVNEALGVQPDQELTDTAPPAVRAAVGAPGSRFR
jgi:uncharacterized peroxidase-related enzyme